MLGGLKTWSQSGWCLVLGEINASTVDTKYLRTEMSETPFEQELVDATITYTMVQNKKETIRYDPDSESSLLDLILTDY